jgi:hypothetical protein
MEFDLHSGIEGRGGRSAPSFNATVVETGESRLHELPGDVIHGL